MQVTDVRTVIAIGLSAKRFTQLARSQCQICFRLPRRHYSGLGYAITWRPLPSVTAEYLGVPQLCPPRARLGFGIPKHGEFRPWTKRNFNISGMRRLKIIEFGHFQASTRH
jgi:hypothetical protein